MTDELHARNRAALTPLRRALYDCEPESVLRALQAVFHPQAVVHLATPLEDLEGPHGLFDRGFKPLQHAIPDLERRDTIVMAGPSGSGANWVGCCGYYTGTFMRPWLDIPPTGHQVATKPGAGRRERLAINSHPREDHDVY